MLVVAFSALARSAERVEVDGFSLELSDGIEGVWTVTGIEESSLSAILPGTEGESLPRAAAQLRRLDHFPLVTAGHLPEARRAFEESFRGEPGVERFEVRDMDCVHLDGAPSYRIRSELESGGETVEQLQFLVTGDRAYLLTFTARDGELEELEGDLDRLVGSARVERTPVLASMTPTIACALVAALIKILWCHRRRGSLSLSEAR